MLNVILVLIMLTDVLNAQMVHQPTYKILDVSLLRNVSRVLSLIQSH
jgi:hypothetical protein